MNPNEPIHNHPIGSCSRFNNDAFIWIPKNASSTLKFIFGEKPYTTIYDFDVETHWVILRDPILRWKSGIVEYISRGGPSSLDIKERLEWVLDNIDQIEFDEHTAPQTSFLQYTGYTRYIDTSKEFWVHKLIVELDLPSPPVGDDPLKLNTTAEYKDKLEMKHYIINKVMSTAFENRLREYYSEDFKLIEQVS